MQTSSTTSFLKKEFNRSFEPTCGSNNDFASPVNNFLKDASQIENEIAEEINNNKEFCICMNGRAVPVSEVLRLPMEENY